MYILYITYVCLRIKFKTYTPRPEKGSEQSYTHKPVVGEDEVYVQDSLLSQSRHDVSNVV